MILFCYLVFSIYAITIALLIYGFSKIKNYSDNGKNSDPKSNFTIIVPFRNEAENLPQLLQSFSKLNYPKNLFELILVDDDSAQAFNPGIQEYRIRVIENSRISASPKKDALFSAIRIITSDWIITTDADCTVHQDWLLTLDSYIQQHHPEMIAGAVAYESQNSFLEQFQQLDMASLQAATIGSFGLRKPFMCNGANFAYTKSIFTELNGFEGNDSIASGDDVFLLQKAVALFPEKVHYLKAFNNVVFTKPLNDWKSLFYQRVRWASKTGSYQSTFGKFLALAVFAGNCSWLLAIGGFLISGFPLWLPLLLIKCVIDYILIRKYSIYLKQRTTIYYIAASLFYPFFSTGVAVYSMIGTYEWKGRKFNRK